MIDMYEDLLALLGARLDEIAKSSIVTSLNEQPQTEMIDDRLYMKFSKSGILIDAELDGTAASIFLYGPSHNDYEKYCGCLPEGLSYSYSRADVHKLLGNPSAAGGPAAVALIGNVPAWDRYDRASYSIHLQYSDAEQSISLVTLMRPDSVPQ